MTLAEYLAKRLRENGVTRFFGIPGGPSIPYLDAFRKEGIRFILTSHESAASVMADVTARLTGVTGVCHGTFGPGATNLSTGVGGALLDRSPVLALTSEMPDEWLQRTTQMNIGHQALYKPLTKATFRLTVSNAASVIDKAMALASDEYPGPVHLGLPAGLAEREIKPGRTSGKKTDIGPDSNHIPERARVLLASARRPIIAAGLTAVRQNSGQALLSFLETHRVPVVVTPMAGGLLPHDHPCFAGVLFHALSNRLGRLTEKADLVIGLGYDPVEYNYESWMPPVPLVHLDTAENDMPGETALAVTAHADKWFDILDHVRGHEDMLRLSSEAREEIRNALDSASEGFTAVTVIRMLSEELPSGTIVTSDVGSHLHLLGQMWDPVRHGRLIMTNGWSSMGFGLPAANAAALCNPGSHVVCITGDGGFLMSAGEIMTARRYGLNVIVVVLADGELNLIRLKEEWKGMDPYGVALYEGPLFSSDRFLGSRVIRAAGAEEMSNAVRDALHTDGITVIEAAIDPSAYGKLIAKA